MAEHGRAWQSMAEHGRAWESMAEHGRAWESMGKHGITYQNIEFTSIFVLHFSPLAMSSCFTKELQTMRHYYAISFSNRQIDRHVQKP
jgi:hypothetical protein